MITRLVVALAVISGFQTGTADIKADFIQSGPILREVYVRPPFHHVKRGLLWKLTKLPYELVEVGRQWLETVQN